jgi:hypothetical protein
MVKVLVDLPSFMGGCAGKTNLMWLLHAVENHL